MGVNNFDYGLLLNDPRELTKDEIFGILVYMSNRSEDKLELPKNF